ncbi:MAG: helix-turn-helix domain-containing protein [Lachnospiraceae bacterium]|nr:helix-turn-helix domain-containing protein [Lachnospiraceae bacterium]MCM1279464.1 helix-turn-helix domain-containing protein [Robinsoniella sp.]
MIEGYITVQDTAKKWGITVRSVQIMCAEGKIKGVTKFGKAWAIPVDAQKPTDNRVVTGEYCNWRKRSSDEAGK